MPGRYPAAIAPAVTAGVAIHADALIQAAAVVGGLALGAMWRAGSLRSEGRSWDTVRGDLAISAMIGGANAVLTLVLAQWMNAGVMVAMLLGVLVGATGIRAVPVARDALLDVLRRKLLADDKVREIDPAVLPPKIEELARRLNEEKPVE